MYGVNCDQDNLVCCKLLPPAHLCLIVANACSAQLDREKTMLPLIVCAVRPERCQHFSDAHRIKCDGHDPCKADGVSHEVERPPVPPVAPLRRALCRQPTRGRTKRGRLQLLLFLKIIHCLDDDYIGITFAMNHVDAQSDHEQGYIFVRLVVVLRSHSNTHMRLRVRNQARP